MVTIFQDKNAFKLPYVGRDDFLLLMRSGIGYDKKRRIFFIKDPNSYETIMTVLSQVLKDDVDFLQICTTCKRVFPCRDVNDTTRCEHWDYCDTKRFPMYCICDDCRKEPQLYEKMVEANQRLINEIMGKK